MAESNFTDLSKLKVNPQGLEVEKTEISSIPESGTGAVSGNAQLSGAEINIEEQINQLQDSSSQQLPTFNIKTDVEKDMFDTVADKMIPEQQQEEIDEAMVEDFIRQGIERGFTREQLRKGYEIGLSEGAFSVNRGVVEKQIDVPIITDVKEDNIGVKFGGTISELGKKLRLQSQTDDGIIESGFKFLGNLPGNTIQLAGDMIGAVSDPAETITSAEEAGSALIEKGLNKVFSTDAGQSILGSLGVSEEKLNKIKEEGYYTSEEKEIISDSISKEIKKLGEEGRIKEILIENPVDVLLTLLGGLGIAKNVAKSKGFTDTVEKIETTEKALNPIKIQAEGVGLTKDVLGKVKDTFFPVKDLDDIILEVTQGKKKDISSAKEAISKISTEGIDTYEALGNRLGDKISEISRKQDELLPNTPKYSIDELKTTQGKRSTNFIENALDDLEKVGNETNDLNMLNKVDDFRGKEKFSEKDINDLARFYGGEFKQKSFDNQGNPRTSVSATKFENNRVGLKNKTRELLPDDTMKLLDGELSNLFTTKGLIEKVDGKITDLAKKARERGLGQKVGGAIAEVIDKVSLGATRAFLDKLLPRNVGNKTLNHLDLQEDLNKNLKNIEKLNRKMDKKIGNNAFIKGFKDIVGENALKIEVTGQLGSNLEDNNKKGQ